MAAEARLCFGTIEKYAFDVPVLPEKAIQIIGNDRRFDDIRCGYMP